MHLMHVIIKFLYNGLCYCIFGAVHCQFADEIPQTKTKSVSFSSVVVEEMILPSNTEDSEDGRWRESCPIGRKGEIKRIDLKVIEPYKKCLSHAGYFHHYSTTQLSKPPQPSRFVSGSS